MQPITLGDDGDAVLDIQRRLCELGHDDVPRTGTFDEATRRVVRLFQQQRRLPADGIVGPDTWTALTDAAHALGDRLLYLTRPLLRGDDVRELQRILSRLGFDTGATDGIHGPETDEALRDFQHNIGVEVDGIAGPTTLAQLRSLRRSHQAVTSFEVLERHGNDRFRPSLAGVRVLVDPARGPDRPGHEVGGWTEDRIAFDIAQRVRGRLAALGAVPVLSRAADATPTPSDRAALANRLEVDVVLSIACAADDAIGAHGAAAQYFGDGEVTSEQGRLLADHCVDAVSEQLGTPNCHSHPSTSAVLRESRAPAAIIEVGFVSNPVEGPKLATAAHRHEVAAALTAAVATWATGQQHDALVAAASAA